MLSIIIITLNEENNIARAIRSANFADEVIVVDSSSSDNTVTIAKQLGARVFNKEFLGYGAQKNYATSLCKYDWIFSLDADEEITPDLKLSILSTIQNENKRSPNITYQVNRKTFFRDKWIKNGGWYPDYVRRLYKKNNTSWSNCSVHENLTIDDTTSLKMLDGYLHHFSFPSFDSQIKTNIKYAKLGAKSLKDQKKRPYLFQIILKPFVKFIECYLLKKGFLDGKEGFIIAINAAYSIFMKYTFSYFKEID